MKKVLLLIILFANGYLSAQLNRIDKAKIIPKEIDFSGSVRRIILTEHNINKKNEGYDTIKTITEISFTKKGKIQSVKNYDKSNGEIWRIVEFDKLSRIVKMSKKDGIHFIPFVKQYFSNKTEFPDSTITNNLPNYKEKYINHFKNSLVIKQDHFVNGSLSDYRTYKYNEKGQLIEDLYHNPDNVTDETVVFKSDNEISFYPEKLTLYEHKTINDTIIITKIRPKFSLKEVKKTFSAKNFTIEIVEDYDKDFLETSRYVYTSKDSTYQISCYYKNKKEIKSYFKTFITSNSIVSKSKMEGYSNNEERTEIIKIDIVSDKFNNWTKKTYSKDNTVTKILERKIEYY